MKQEHRKKGPILDQCFWLTNLLKFEGDNIIGPLLLFFFLEKKNQIFTNVDINLSKTEKNLSEQTIDQEFVKCRNDRVKHRNCN